MQIFSKISLLSILAILLPGCFGGGLSAINAEDLTVTTPSGPSALTKLDNVEGTMGYGMDIETKTYEANRALTTKLSRQSGGSGLSVANGPNFSARKNFIGGLDIEIDDREISLTSDEIVADTAWYKTVGTNDERFSLSLWNAGKDARGGLLANAEGQNFHKIVGYDYTDNSTTTQSRGHIVYGEEMALSQVQELERTATYHGYFSVFITPKTMDGDHYDNNSAIMSGGAQFVADFDNNTISGRSTDVQRREAGSDTFVEEAIDVQFESASILDNGQGGVLYSGDITSNHAPIDGAQFDGTFFGEQAQETAGVINGTTTDPENGDRHVVDGFFSAAR